MRSLVFKILFWSGIGPISVLILRWKKRVPIFLFHRISNHYDPFSEPISTSAFEKIIRNIKRFYKTETLQNLVDTSLQNNSCCIVFDDGLEDFYVNSLPILQKHNVPTSLFLPVSDIEKNQSIWNNRLFEWVLGLEKRNHQVGFKKMIFEINPTSTEFYRQVMSLHKELCMHSIEDIHRFLEQNKNDYKLKEVNLCSWEMLEELHGYGVDIQCHTFHHLYLKGKSIRFIEKELAESKKVLESKFLKKVDFVAYPVGAYDRYVIRTTKTLFKAGFSVDEQFVQLSQIGIEDYNYTIPRFNVQDSTFEEMFFRCLGFHKWIAKLKS
jgi:peptidoglycan/xylan/chitin deacetylase (PgdA/CDA1 family)